MNVDFKKLLKLISFTLPIFFLADVIFDGLKKQFSWNEIFGWGNIIKKIIAATVLSLFLAQTKVKK